jgi:protein tyrosine phosphatase (PTP) superfamily phosphohydrolase (DUF442 family)
MVATAAVAYAPTRGDSLLAQLASVKDVARPYPWLLTGGRPDAGALAALAKAGVRDIFDLRDAYEKRGDDERTVATSLGLRYLPIPIGAGDFNDTKFTAIRHHLIAHGPAQPMFIHGVSGDRVGAALLPWLVLDQGLGEDLALEMARALGLADPHLTEQAREYIQEHQPPNAVR